MKKEGLAGVSQFDGRRIITREDRPAPHQRWLPAQAIRFGHRTRRLFAIGRSGMAVVQEDGELLAGAWARQSYGRFEQLVLYARRQVSPNGSDRAAQGFREFFRGHPYPLCKREEIGGNAVVT